MTNNKLIYIAILLMAAFAAYTWSTSIKNDAILAKIEEKLTLIKGNTLALNLLNQNNNLPAAAKVCLASYLKDFTPYSDKIESVDVNSEERDQIDKEFYPSAKIFIHNCEQYSLD